MACYVQLLCKAQVENYASGRMKQELYLKITAHLQQWPYFNT